MSRPMFLSALLLCCSVVCPVAHAEPDDTRYTQAGVLWSKFGHVLSAPNFKQYLAEVPIMPPNPRPGYYRPILVDGRVVERFGLEQYCRLAGVTCETNKDLWGPDQTLSINDMYEPFEPSTTKKGIYWIWAQDGAEHKGKAPTDCRTEFAKRGEIGLNITEGIALYLQSPNPFQLECIDLSESVISGLRGLSASLCFNRIPVDYSPTEFTKVVGLSWRGQHGEYRGFGSASRQR